MSTETRSTNGATAQPRANGERDVDVAGTTGTAEGSVLLTIDDAGIAVVRLGAPSERMVTLTETRMASLERVLDRLAEPDVRGVVVTGPGPGMFAAGADVHAIDAIDDVATGERAATRGRSLFGRFTALRVPVVGAIEGPCLGGGLELALCFDVRVASDRPGTQIGLPEVKLGIVPGFGGTQRLPRLIGLPAALDLILQGKLLDGARARKLGLVDRVAPADRLLDAARQEVDRLVRAGRKAPRRKLRGFAFWASRFAPLRAFVARKVRRTLRQGPGRFYEAPRRALECCLDAFRLPVEQGFAREARALAELIVGPQCKALVHLFFLTERAKKPGRDPAARDIARALVVGGGVMGAGIGGLLAERGVRTRLCDLDPSALARAKARLHKSVAKRLRTRRLERHAAQAIEDRLAVAHEFGSLAGVDLFLEAVVEDLDVKRKLFADAVARGLPATALLASNTSSLPIDAMAEGLPSPTRVVGIHFFNPPEKMPLVEIVRGTRTDAATVATACRLATQLGKFPVVVADRPGFLVNRCLAPYLNEAARLLLEGNEPEDVDRALLDFGMPMGPCRLLDEIGFDVATKVSAVLSAAFPDRMEPCELFQAMVDAKALGQKSGGGLYAANGTGRGPGRDVLAALRTSRGGALPPASRTEILRRLVHPMVDEAFRCLDEEVVISEDDLDLGLVMGIGFPPFTGGITRYARAEGLGRIVESLDDMARRLGRRFAAADALRRRAVQGDDEVAGQARATDENHRVEP
jgi:3-hydroxyacyl-CoA dehydrogenase/enoyl-CoA hydratase/3-hydroxybutyryl-CoA epimerase